MYKQFLLLIIFVNTVYSLDLNGRQNEACLHLYKAAEIVGCHTTDKMIEKTDTIRVCDQFYLTQENDTCETISQNLNVSLNNIKNIIDCENVTTNQLVCIELNSDTKKMYERFIEPFGDSDLDFLDSKEANSSFIEDLIRQSDQEFAEIFKLEITEGLRQHNFYRELHKADELVYNETIGAEAQKWAEQLASTKELVHNYKNPYGENIAQACGFPDFTGKTYFKNLKMFEFFIKCLWRQTSGMKR